MEKSRFVKFCAYKRLSSLITKQNQRDCHSNQLYRFSILNLSSIAFYFGCPFKTLGGDMEISICAIRVLSIE